MNRSQQQIGSQSTSFRADAMGTLARILAAKCCSNTALNSLCSAFAMKQMFNTEHFFWAHIHIIMSPKTQFTWSPSFLIFKPQTEDQEDSNIPQSLYRSVPPQVPALL